MSGSRATFPILLVHGTAEIETWDEELDGSSAGVLRTVIQVDGDIITYVSVPLPSPVLRVRHDEKLAAFTRSLAHWRRGIVLALRLPRPLGWMALGGLCWETVTWQGLWEAYAGWGLAWAFSSVCVIGSRPLILWGVSAWVRRSAALAD